jgi:hypothetical protein|tara:strand:- start:811 stop:1323 length:513 start_codon:yes stop_codon:yes gene_type:complete
MTIQNEPLLDAPIPGQSLTAELGNRPWQQPSELKTLEDAVDYYIPRLGDPALMNKTLSIIESGVSLTSIAEIFTLSGTMEGKHNVDVAVLVSPVIVEFLKGLGDLAGIKYTIDADEEDKSDVSPLDMIEAEKELLKEEDVEELVTDTIQDNVEETETMEEPKGLMARRSA